MKHRLKIVLTLCALLLLALLAPSASAGQYVVHSCKLPDGRIAPADGWSTHGAANYSWFDNGCSRGAPLTAGLGGPSQPGNRSGIGWGFDSGAADIRGYRIVRSGRPVGFTGGVSMVLYSSDQRNDPGGGRAVDYCAAYSGCSGISGVATRTAAQLPGASRAWFFTLGCGGANDASCLLAPGQLDFGYLQIESAQFTLEDSELPEAASAAYAGGGVHFFAADSVSGVRRATLEVDGQEVAAFAPQTTEGSCAELGFSALPDFTLRRPCPEQAEVELAPPPGRVAPGKHVMRARVFDAAGNSVTAFGPQEVEIAGDAVSAKATAYFVPDGPLRRGVNYGRQVKLSGRLLEADGRPLAAAEIEVAQSAPAARSRLRTLKLVTDADGRYSSWLNATASRELVLRHARSGALLEQSIDVRSRIFLRARRSRVAPLGRMRLTGRIQTAQTRRGANVAIKALTRRGWLTVGIARTDRRGRFAFSYRFKRTRRASFSFRAVALRSSDLAVSPRPSNRVRVRVG
jgi:hypothetical protein